METLTKTQHDEFDKELKNRLESAAAVGKVTFDDLDNEDVGAITAAFLRSSYGADTFCDINIIESMALTFSAPTKAARDSRKADLCTYLRNVAKNGAQDYVDKVLPGMVDDWRHYVKHDALADNNLMLDQALMGIGVFRRFGG